MMFNLTYPLITQELAFPIPGLTPTSISSSLNYGLYNDFQKRYLKEPVFEEVHSGLIVQKTIKREKQLF